MRSRRRAAATDDGSARICDALIEVVGGLGAATVMVFDPVPGEPDLGRFVDWCADEGIATVAPVADRAAPDPVDPGSVDVVIVPGLAFTSDGRRLGQGGGWYDRFLAATRPDCLAIGVCFSAQLVDELPAEPHDVVLDCVIIDDMPAIGWVSSPSRRGVRRSGR